ncbi:MAG: hypothetical protein O4859_09315, partial [Trichodesmium sp. St18_bin1]|nr:hypothetical protein [Trichodesmium sp. St18_bin1]
LKPLRTIGGHRYYTDEHINQIKGIVKNPRINVIYCRVSGLCSKTRTIPPNTLGTFRLKEAIPNKLCFSDLYYI